MKKIHFLLMTAFVAFGFAACSPNPPEEEEPSIFTVEVTNITSNAATITVQCADEANADAPFYWDVFTAEDLEGTTGEAVMNDLLQQIYDAYSEYYGENVIMDVVAVTGTDSYDYDGLSENTEYFVVSALLDSETSRAIPGKVEVVSFKTLEYTVAENVTFELTVEDIDATSAYVSCTPNPEDARYILNWFTKEEWNAATDKSALFQEIVDEYVNVYYPEYNDGESVEDFLLYYLVYDSPVEGTISLDPSTEYVLAAVAINLADNKVYGEVASYEFASLEAVMSDNTFEVTAEGATLTITPSNNDPYFFFFDEKTTFEGYGQTYLESLQEWAYLFNMYYGEVPTYEGAVTVQASDIASEAGIYVIYGAGYAGYFNTEAFAYEWTITDEMLAASTESAAPKKLNVKRSVKNLKTLQSAEKKSVQRAYKF